MVTNATEQEKKKTFSKDRKWSFGKHDWHHQNNIKDTEEKTHSHSPMHSLKKKTKTVDAEISNSIKSDVENTIRVSEYSALILCLNQKHY